VGLFGRGRSAPERRGTPADLLAVGLGNPGREYAGSRHNVGAEAVALLARRHGADLKREKRIPAELGQAKVGSKLLGLGVPLTYMNESGQAVAPLCRRFGIDDVEALVVIHDELDLEPGRLKVKVGGGLAGHNGLRSVKSHLHDDGFVRVRIGVGKPPSKQRGADHVLRKVPARERALLDEAVERAADAVDRILADGVERAMGEVNRLP
jgi:peptidyl-tRNA hydrolase, PTH1 family